MLDRPVLITGTPRSGKTCIFGILCGEDEFYSVQEPLMLWQPSASLQDDVCGEEQALEADKSRIRAECERLARQAGKQRYLDNLSYHAIRLPYVHAVMPEARIIHVVRNPIDAVPEMVFGWTRRVSLSKALKRKRFGTRSLRAVWTHASRLLNNYVSSRVLGSRQTWGPVVPGLVEYRRTHSIIETAAFQWAEMVRIAREDIERFPEMRVLDVRYEDLVRDPAAEAARIAEFAEVRHPSRVVELAASTLCLDYVHYEQIRNDHTEEEIDSIRRVVAPVASQLNYSLT